LRTHQPPDTKHTTNTNKTAEKPPRCPQPPDRSRPAKNIPPASTGNQKINNERNNNINPKNTPPSINQRNASFLDPTGDPTGDPSGDDPSNSAHRIKPHTIPISASSAQGSVRKSSTYVLIVRSKHATPNAIIAAIAGKKTEPFFGLQCQANPTAIKPAMLKATTDKLRTVANAIGPRGTHRYTHRINQGRAGGRDVVGPSQSRLDN
jgi:hypothetical protein